MSEHVYKSIELTGSSKKSIDDAIRNAITRAAKSMRNMRWFQVTDTRGYIENGEIKTRIEQQPMAGHIKKT